MTPTDHSPPTSLGTVLIFGSDFCNFEDEIMS